MYELSLQMQDTFLADIANAISLWGFSEAMRNAFWVIPTVQTIHILAIAGVFGSVFMINLRILGLAGGSRTMTQVAARYMPWVWWGLLVLLGSGLLLIIAEPQRELLNPLFWLKMILVVIAVLVSAWFQGTVRRNVAMWETSHGGRVFIRVGAVAVILFWCVIAVLGRWIAYI